MSRGSAECVVSSGWGSARCSEFYESVEQLQMDLDEWLVHCNQVRPHQCYRNLGRRPIDTVNLFLKERGSASQLDLTTVRDDA